MAGPKETEARNSGQLTHLGSIIDSFVSVSLPAPPACGRHAEFPLECKIERRLGFVSDPLGDIGKRSRSTAQLLCGDLQTPAREILHGWLTEHLCDPLRERRTRQARLAREFIDGPRVCGTRMQHR